MRKAVIVIGSNYGDEGKGLAAAHFAGENGAECLNILINGGAQRGHTVEDERGRRHVFHHFGSAALKGAVSCADEDYIVNPMLYCIEREELQWGFGLEPALIISDSCRVSTPWDMMLGQIIEENRGGARHGSCGCGIQETRLRYLNTDWALRFGRLKCLSKADYDDYCRRIVEEYVPERLNALGMTADEEWQGILRNPGVAEHAWQDLQTLIHHTGSYADWVETAKDWPVLLFEAGQGLALDQDNMEDFPHLTPSHTTSLISAKRIAALPGQTDTEVVYVTRTYFTRHGAGPFPTECGKDAINPDMMDYTNMPNPHQHTLRYGRFDGQAMMKRVDADRQRTAAVLPDIRSAVLVTHLNETGGALCGEMALKELTARFEKAYLSDSPLRVYTM